MDVSKFDPEQVDPDDPVTVIDPTKVEEVDSDSLATIE